MAVKPALILLISDQPDLWISAHLEENYELYRFADVRDAIKSVQSIRYDLLVLDNALFGDQTPDVVKEIKRRFPSVPIILLSDQMSADAQNELMKAGADDFITKTTSVNEVHHRIRLILNPYRQNRALAQFNHNLTALVSLSRLLYSASDQYTLIGQAITLLRSTFQLYGIVVFLQTGDVFHQYVGSEEVTDKSRLYEGVIRPDDCDPFYWTFRNRITQMYKDITVNSHYTPIPFLAEARAATIMPLTYQNKAVGAMGIFAPAEYALSDEDLVLYEQFAAHLTSALHNVNQVQAQHMNIQASQHLLRAWQIFAKLNTAEEIAYTLCELNEGIPYVGKSFVWFNTDETGATQEILVDIHDNQIVSSVTQTGVQRLTGRLTHIFDGKLQPVLLKGKTTYDATLNLLFAALQTRQIILIPVTDSARLIGCVVAAVVDEYSFNVENINLMKSLSYAAGLALERITLIGAIAEKNNRLEAILESIAEGVFFVDDSDEVAFCNPQVAELTSINASQVMNQDAEVLLRAIASGTADPAKTYAQLQEAKNIVLNPDTLDTEYPIVEIALVNLERDLHLEFVHIDGLDDQKISWAGVIRSNTLSEHSSKMYEVLINSMSENLRMPYANIRSTVGTLFDQHGYFNYRDRDLLLNQVKSGVERVGQLWDNFLGIFDLQMGGLVLNRENVNVQQLVEKLLNNPAFSKFQRQFSVEMPLSLPVVRVDEFRFERALANLVQRALEVSPSGAAITITAEKRDHDVVITIRDGGEYTAEDQPALLFDYAKQIATSHGVDFGLYFVQELVRRHGGRIWAEPNEEQGTAIIIALPDSTPAIKAPAKRNLIEAAEPSVERADRPASRAPNRAPSTIMIVQGHSTLVKTLTANLQDEYELIVYQSADEAVEDVYATHLDLVVIDTTLSEADVLDTCRRMRKRTEVPIILIADKASDSDKVQGLNAGADDFITKPVSDEELMARIQVIFKRQLIPDRTSEPLIIGDLYIDFARREVCLSTKPVELTRIEYDLLRTMIINKGQVLTHKQLLERVWGPDYEDETHYLWVNISRLRKKLTPKPDSPRYIHTQPGTGYFFDAP